MLKAPDGFDLRMPDGVECRVLIAHHAELIRVLLRVYLERVLSTPKRPIRPFVVSNARDGRAAIREVDFDLCLVALSMNGNSDGLDLVREASAAGSAIPCVVLSAYPSAWRDKALAAGAVDCLQLPFELREVARLIAQWGSRY